MNKEDDRGARNENSRIERYEKYRHDAKATQYKLMKVTKIRRFELVKHDFITRFTHVLSDIGC